MALKQHQWHQSGRTFKDDSILGRFVYEGRMGEEQTPDGLGGWLPYLWKSGTKELQYGHDSFNLEFASDKQIIKKAANVLCSSFKFFVQAYIAGKWVNQPHGAAIRNIHNDEVFRDGSWVADDTKATGFLSFPDAELSFGSNPYDLYLGLEVGNDVRGKMGIRFRAPQSGQVRFQVVLDGLKKLPTDWEWIWATYIPEKNKENRKIGIRIKNLQWVWTYEEAPYRDIIVEDNPDGTKKITVIMGPYDYTENEWLTIYPDTWGPTAVVADNDDADDYGTPPVLYLSGYDNDGNWLLHSTNANVYGIRFQNVTIGQGATINVGTHAEGFVKYVTGTYPAGGTWYGCDYDNVVDFNTTDPADMDRTTANSGQTIDPAPPDENWMDSSELQTLVKEIVDRGSWVSGNAMAFVLVAAGDGAKLQWQDYDVQQPLNSEPKLTIEYTEAAGGLSIPIAMQHYAQQ